MPAFTIRTRPEQCSNRRKCTLIPWLAANLPGCVFQVAVLRLDGGGKGRRGMPKENRATSSVFDRSFCSRRRLFCQASNCPVNCFDTLIRSRESCQYAPTHHLDCRSLSTATWQRRSRSHPGCVSGMPPTPTSRTLSTPFSLCARSLSRHGEKRKSRVPVQMWQGAQRGEPSPGADVTCFSPVQVQMWRG